MNKEYKLKKLPDYFLSAPQDKDLDNRNYLLWQKVNEIITVLNNSNEDILIEVSRMIEKRTEK